MLAIATALIAVLGADEMSLGSMRLWKSLAPPKLPMDTWKQGFTTYMLSLCSTMMLQRGIVVSPQKADTTWKRLVSDTYDKLCEGKFVSITPTFCLC